jgi:RimJ/RimL family protein N-acetyltransferase
MIEEIESTDCEKVRPLVKGVPHTCVVDAIIDGTSPGMVWVDDALCPTAALVSSVEGHYAVGSEHSKEFNRSLKALVIGTILPKGKANGWSWFNLRCSSDGWVNVIENIFDDTTPVKEEREFYTIEQLEVDWQRDIPPGFRMVCVDEEVLGRADLRNIARDKSWAEWNFGSIGGFLKHGFGFCLLYEADIVSWCMADCVSGDRCEIGIHTDGNYRRRGFATLTTAATVDHCLSHGLRQVGWHCARSNVASAATARKVGFKKVLDYHAFQIDVREINQKRIDGGDAKEMRT